MTYLIGIAVVIFLVWFIRGCLKMVRWNNDPDQQTLVDLLIGTANGGQPHEVATFLTQKRWPPKEVARRLMHASTAIDRLEQPPALKAKCYEIAKRLAVAS
jgi:hypothetical protein